FSAATASTGRAWAFCGWASAIRVSVWKRRRREPSRPEPLLPEREVDAGTRARPPTSAGAGGPAAARTFEPAGRGLLRSLRPFEGAVVLPGRWADVESADFGEAARLALARHGRVLSRPIRAGGDHGAELR